MTEGEGQTACARGAKKSEEGSLRSEVNVRVVINRVGGRDTDLTLGNGSQEGKLIRTSYRSKGTGGGGKSWSS